MESEAPPTLVARYAPAGCDGVSSAFALPQGGAVLVGDSALISGWIMRFDDALTPMREAESGSVYADLGLAPDGRLWVAAGGWSQPATIERFSLEGQRASLLGRREASQAQGMGDHQRARHRHRARASDYIDVFGA